MKLLRILTTLVLGLATVVPHSLAESAEQLQQKLQAAQLEIETLKAKIAAMQTQVQQAQANNQLPPTRPLDQALSVEHPIVTAYELSSYGQTDQAAVKNLLKGKVVSVTGSVDRFNESLGRGFKVYLNTSGSTMQVGGDFKPVSSVRSTYTAEDGSEMVIDDERRGLYTLAALNENVVISGFFQSVSRRQVLLNNCVLQKQ